MSETNLTKENERVSKLLKAISDAGYDLISFTVLDYMPADKNYSLPGVVMLAIKPAGE